MCEKENVQLAGSGCMRVGIFKQDMWGSLDGVQERDQVIWACEREIV